MKRLRIDFHTHTIYSPDSLTRPEKLLATCRRRGIDRVVITDHNTIQGALHAKELDPERVIVGEEINTTEGELLAVYVSEEIPPGLAPLEAITRLREQDALISVSHPFDKIRKGHWELEALLNILPHIDAIETFNARCLWPGFNRRAARFAREHQIPGTHGSDAHAAFEIGNGALNLPQFDDTQSLKAALLQAKPVRRLPSLPWVHFASRYAVWYKKRQG
jgi:predicted metal-dependent phosphoesterase TrpH